MSSGLRIESKDDPPWNSGFLFTSHKLQMRTGMTSLLPHYPPCYGREKTMKSLRLFAEPFMPPCRASRP